MNTAYFFDLYGKLLKTCVEDVSYEMFRSGLFVELDVEDVPWLGTVEKVKHFPPDANGNESLHIFIYNFNPKHSELGENCE